MKSSREPDGDCFDTIVTMTASGAPTRSSSRVTAFSTLKRVAPKWWLITRLWFVSEERWRARGYAAAAVGLSVVTAVLLLKVSYVQNSFQSALSEKNQAEFYSALRQFMWVIAAAAPLFAGGQYVEGRVVIEWRRWLAERLLAAYFADHAYYRLKLGGLGAGGGGTGLGGAGGVGAGAEVGVLDNPDQRICDDVRSFASSSVVLAVGIIRKVFYCFMFGGLLWRIAPHLLFFLLGYALLGTLVTTAGFGRRLMHLTYAVLQREADLRFALVRVRENAESVAFYSGDRHESSIAATRLERAVSVGLRRLRVESWLAAWTNAYSYATILAPALLLAPRYFAGEIRFGDISQCAYAFHRIEEALNYIVSHLAELSGLAAQTDRLDSLLVALRSQGASMHGLGGGVRRAVRGTASGSGQAEEEGGLTIEGLMLFTPGGEQMLVRDLDLTLLPGQSLLIVGPSGCGKSSILRAAAGLWTQGSGTITAPPPGHTFFLPQKPYMPLGTLRQQLLFPAGAPPAPHHAVLPAALSGMLSPTSSARQRRKGGDGDRSKSSIGDNRGSLEADRADVLLAAGKGNGLEAAAERLSLLGPAENGGSGDMVGPAGPLLSDAELERLLKVVRLPDLSDRVGGLGAERDWSHVLSLGEQQRVAMLRLLCHRPALAYLDEATSAVDAEVEAALYAALRERCACYVSIGHRKQLVAYHTHVLQCEGEGRWRLMKAQEWERQHS